MGIRFGRLSPGRLLAALGLAAVAAALAGCGVAGTVDPVASAATKSQQAGTARVDFSATMSSPSLGDTPFTLTGHGLVSADEAEMSMDMSDVLRQAGAPAGIDGTIDAVYLKEGGDAVMYMRMGMLAGKLPDGKHWMKLDMSKLGRSLGVDFDKLMGSASGPTQDPSQLLAMLRATSGNVEDLGTETIAGIETTHYRADVDLAKAAKLKGISGDMLRRLGQGIPTDVPEDVWVGTDGLVHQLRIVIDTASNATPMHMTMTMRLSDYGTNATITAPDASNVFDATDLVQGTAGAPSS